MRLPRLRSNSAARSFQRSAHIRSEHEHAARARDQRTLCRQPQTHQHPWTRLRLLRWRGKEKQQDAISFGWIKKLSNQTPVDDFTLAPVRTRECAADRSANSVGRKRCTCLREAGAAATSAVLEDASRAHQPPLWESCTQYLGPLLIAGRGIFASSRDRPLFDFAKNLRRDFERPHARGMIVDHARNDQLVRLKTVEKGPQLRAYGCRRSRGRAGQGVLDLRHDRWRYLLVQIAGRVGELARSAGAKASKSQEL